MADRPAGGAARRLPIGAEVRDGGVDFAVRAPGARSVDLLVEGRGPTRLADAGGGRFVGPVAGIGAGARYRFRVDGGRPVPDPASRFQPDGPHGVSEVIDPASFGWTDARWRGVTLDDAVIYELHVGAFTPEGTFAAAETHLAGLADLGVTVIELLPLGDFPGRFGWGYDGVDLFAPTRNYGRPDDLRRFVDRAHAAGIAVILDVVYNHVGPDGCYLAEFSDAYFSRRYTSDWGDTFNFDDTGAEIAREFVLANVRHWIEEYHLDGLRLDATQQISDASDRHILAEIAQTVREAAAGRHSLVVAENEPQDARLVRDPARGGYGIDALWNDDLHHSAMVALTGFREAYYTDYLGGPAEFVAAARHGFLFQGQRYAWQRARRGAPAFDIPPRAHVVFLQNHDQVANSLEGARIPALTSPARLRALTAFVLLMPGTPMLFMGQEFGASTPFLYFADHSGELADAVREGRREFLRQFPTYATPAAQAAVPDPADPATFERSTLDHAEREAPGGVAALALHRDLLRLRRSEPAIRAASIADRSVVEGAVLGPGALVLRFFGVPEDGGPGGRGDRLLVVNLGAASVLEPAPEPLLAPPSGQRWTIAWTSDDLAYGGPGTPDAETEDGWRLPAETALLLRPEIEPEPAVPPEPEVEPAVEGA